MFKEPYQISLRICLLRHLGAFFCSFLNADDTNPSSGFQDKESGDHLESEYNKFIEKCKTEGCPLSAAPVSSRSPFQLAVMLSPLYLLSTFRLSKKSFHRRTVIDLAARLGPHKPPCILAVENVIWDAIFSLAEGRLSVYQVLRNLTNSLPWSDIDTASNADQQWFKPASRMFLYLVKS